MSCAEILNLLTNINHNIWTDRKYAVGLPSCASMCRILIGRRSETIRERELLIRKGRRKRTGCIVLGAIEQNLRVGSGPNWFLDNKEDFLSVF